MNWVDIAILALLAFGVLVGFARGLIVELAVIVGAFVSLAVAHHEYGAVRAFLASAEPTGAWLTVASYLLVFFVVWAIIVFVAQRIRSVVRFLFLGMLDRLGGAMIGLLQGAVLVELFLYLGKRAPNHALHRAIGHSHLAPAFLHAVPYIDRLFPHVRT